MDPGERFPSADKMRRAIVAAQEQLGIGEVDTTDVGAWVQEVVRPAWTRGELERALGDAPALVTSMAATAELPTIRPRRAPARQAGAAAGRWRAVPWIALAIAACGLALEVARLRSAPPVAGSQAVLREESAPIVLASAAPAATTPASNPTELPPRVAEAPSTPGASFAPIGLRAENTPALSPSESIETSREKRRADPPRRRTPPSEPAKAPSPRADVAPPATVPPVVDPLATQ
jgi:hypothetical protein